MTTQHTTTPDRATLRAALEETRDAFHALLAEIPPAAWNRRSRATRWTVRALMTHIALSLADLPKQVAAARAGKSYLALPGWLLAPGGYLLFRWQARGQTKESLARRYDAAHAVALTLLDGVRDDEWSKRTRFLNEGVKSVADLFALPPAHFADHAAQVRESL
jgi:hypothetical protein